MEIQQIIETAIKLKNSEINTEQMEVHYVLGESELKDLDKKLHLHFDGRIEDWRPNETIEITLGGISFVFKK